MSDPMELFNADTEWHYAELKRRCLRMRLALDIAFAAAVLGAFSLCMDHQPANRWLIAIAAVVTSEVVRMVTRNAIAYRRSAQYAAKCFAACERMRGGR